jgi:hypothetical protein
MIRDIFCRNAAEYIKLYNPPPEHVKVIRAVSHCQSGDLGHHVLRCPDCGEIIVLNNSCRNRHCPVCQHKAREAWLENRKAELLDVPYFHLIFTLPHVLNPVVYKYKKIAFDVLFQSVNQTIEIFAADPKWLGAQAGAIAVLHTWGQNLSFHPHIHLVMPAGGLIKDTGEWLNMHPRFFAPVQALSMVFKEIFLKKLIKTLREQKIDIDSDMISKAQIKNWIVFAQKPFKKPKFVIDYLGNYTHRVAISNYRIVKAEDGKVMFWYKDYRQEGKRKLMILPELEFMRRFLQHVLPDNFYKIRYFGFMSNRFRSENIHAASLAIAQNRGKYYSEKSFTDELSKFIEKIMSNPYPCPVCGSKMLCIPIFHEKVPDLPLPDT